MSIEENRIIPNRQLCFVQHSLKSPVVVVSPFGCCFEKPLFFPPDITKTMEHGKMGRLQM